MDNSSDRASEILKSARVEVSPETYAILSLSDSEWTTLLKNPELSPRMETPFMIFKDKWEVTLVLDDIDFGLLQDSVQSANIERGFRLVSFDADLDFDVVGFMARIAAVMADAGISILPISSFARDHLLVRQDDLGNALKALRSHVAEVC